MMLAGRRVPDNDVRELARLVDDPTRTVLMNAIRRETVIVALSISDREQIFRALDDPQTTALAELRATLFLEHEWRVREGLV
jgi:hypothetical protein